MNYIKEISPTVFPTPKHVIINMMPFIMGDNNSIPEEYRQYSSLINSCNLPLSEIGKIGYLTVDESPVIKNNSQRRAGIHTEKHPSRSWGGGSSGWGGFVGGLYMASTINNSCRVWNHYVDEPKPHGDCEHLREVLTNPIDMKKDVLYWMTDGTPHEALPVLEDSYRQFFRLVTSEVSVWYEKHSTKNRLGVQPNCDIITIDKFKYL